MSRAAIQYLRSIGAERIRVEHGGKHPRLVFLYGGRERFHVISGSPSDVLGEKNLLADLRRELVGTNGQKVTGERRKHRRRISRSVPIAISGARLTGDYRAALLSHPSTDLRSLADQAWLEYWRVMMQGKSRL